MTKVLSSFLGVPDAAGGARRWAGRVTAGGWSPTQVSFLVHGQARPIPIKGGKEILICLQSRYSQKGFSDNVPKQVKNVPVFPVWKKRFCISLVKKYFPCNTVPWYILSLFLVCLFIYLFSIHKVELITLPGCGSPSLMVSLET